MADEADLSRLADIVVPPPLPWWPPAPGWWIIAAALLGAAVITAVAGLARWRRNAYRRAALAELAAIGPVSTPASAAAVSAILKRVALVAYPRVEVASLTGEAWLAFLDRTSASDAFSQGAAADLARAPFGAPVRDGGALLGVARRWVTHHRGET
ncbi:DUF4381 domain-containing protein [Chelatococcus asaccharovorans]|uniref:Uncharacterized protein DUF4381 n=1 Tax=Chelatococcus asaccharovorans TaxID=28210 RepID=A0A2V3U0D3_9HYPH|nr:DUF4381 domain-containing protein [Chelatococcus asaccharovorans]MBS7704357.1 DUF4381 domain-containing protein [Chelatococcus asaccharovorans]PXW55765.1 uncharacterized protein DUF4381 [Chelatococcus asaccharovorans]